MTELQVISTEICMMIESIFKEIEVRQEDKDQLQLFNESMSFYLQRDEMDKALYVAKETRDYINETFYV